jgi:homoserine kinase
MTERRRTVRVPASSANLGPGYDVLAAALQIEMELEVSEAGGFSVEAGGLQVPDDRSNLCVRAFERLHPADGLRFGIRSEIPLAAGLGSSAAAIVAGLAAADHMYELGHSTDELFALAAEIEGHPDNVAAALYGGIVICPPPLPASPDAPPPAPARLDPPQGIEPLVVLPAHEVATADARAAMPAEVPVSDATANAAATAHLVLGIERSDLTLIERGLADRIHQPAREHLYPRSMELVRDAAGLGALGATISGAGPAVLVWCYWQHTGDVAEALRPLVEGWAEVRRAPFSLQGADVPEL